MALGGEVFQCGRGLVVGVWMKTYSTSFPGYFRGTLFEDGHGFAVIQVGTDQGMHTAVPTGYIEVKTSQNVAHLGIIAA